MPTNVDVIVQFMCSLMTKFSRIILILPLIIPVGTCFSHRTTRFFKYSFQTKNNLDCLTLFTRGVHFGPEHNFFTKNIIHQIAIKQAVFYTITA